MTTETIPCPCIVDPADGETCDAAIEVSVEIDGQDCPAQYDAWTGWSPREYASLIPTAPLTCPNGHTLTMEQRAALCVEAVRCVELNQECR